MRMKAKRSKLPKVTTKVKRYVATPKLVRKIAKQVMLGQSEQKFVDTNWSKIELYHNAYVVGAFTANLLSSVCLPAEGSTDNSRDGNKIYISGISVPLMLYTKGDRLNTKFRVICIKYSQGYNPFANYTALFDNISGNVMLDKPNPDLVKVIFDKTIGNSNFQTATGSTGNDEQTRFKKFWVPIKRYFTFRDDNTQQYNKPAHNIGLIVVAYDTYGSIQTTDNVGAVQLWQRLYFRDV